MAQQAAEIENLEQKHAEEARAAAEQELEKSKQLQASRAARDVAARCAQQLQELQAEEQRLEQEKGPQGARPLEDRACEGEGVGQVQDMNANEVPPPAAEAGAAQLVEHTSGAEQYSTSGAEHTSGAEAAKLELVMEVSMRDVPALFGSNKAFADTLAYDLAAAAAASPDKIEVRKLEPATGWGGVSPATQQLG